MTEEHSFCLILMKIIDAAFGKVLTINIPSPANHETCKWLSGEVDASQ